MIDTGWEIRAAQVAHLLSAAVRRDEIVAVDALRILRHELRRRNTNKKLAIPIRSREAQRAIDDLGELGVPKNGSPQALHADHVHPLTVDSLHRIDTLQGWVEELGRLRLVVCVTVAENYRLQAVEHTGVTGPAKYAQAGVAFTTADLPW